MRLNMIMLVLTPEILTTLTWINFYSESAYNTGNTMERGLKGNSQHRDRASAKYTKE